MLTCYEGRVDVVPAVDVLGGTAARLIQGDYDRVAGRADLVGLVSDLAATSPAWLHLVQLDGAREGGFDLGILSSVRATAPGLLVQASGGIRDAEAATAVLAAGAFRVVLGTAAFEPGAALSELAGALGERLVVAVDVRDGRVAARGWRSDTGVEVAEALDRCAAAGVPRVLVTAVHRDGTLSGPDLALLRLACDSGLAVVAAGGIRDGADLAAIEALGCEAAVVGRACLEGWRPWADGW